MKTKLLIPFLSALALGQINAAPIEPALRDETAIYQSVWLVSIWDHSTIPIADYAQGTWFAYTPTSSPFGGTPFIGPNPAGTFTYDPASGLATWDLNQGYAFHWMPVVGESSFTLWQVNPRNFAEGSAFIGTNDLNVAFYGNTPTFGVPDVGSTLILSVVTIGFFAAFRRLPARLRSGR